MQEFLPLVHDLLMYPGDFLLGFAPIGPALLPASHPSLPLPQLLFILAIHFWIRNMLTI